MKKSLFTFAAVAFALTACTNTEEVEQGFEQSSKQIGFTSHVNKNTRALTNDNFGKFAVFGSYTTATNTAPIAVFNHVDVTKSEGAWKYNEPRYWINGADYTFYAYSNDNETAQNLTRFDAQNATFTIPDYFVDNTHQKDLVFASQTATGKETGNAPVAFDFKHILSKICFNFKVNFPVGYTVKVDQVEIKNMRDKGSFTGSTSAWSGVARSTGDDAVENDMTNIAISFANNSKESQVLGKKSEGATAVLEETTNFIYVLPFEYQLPNVRIYFRTTITNANDETVSQKRNYGAFKPTWIKGTAYKYNVILTGAEAGLEQIEFTTDTNMDLDEWAQGSETDLNFGSNINN